MQFWDSVPDTIMAPIWSIPLTVLVCGLSAVVWTRAVWWSPLIPRMHSSGEDVYKAGVSLSLPLFFTVSLCHPLSHSFYPLHPPPFQVLYHWPDRSSAKFLLLTLQFYSETQHKHRVSLSNWLKYLPPSLSIAVTGLRWVRRSGLMAEL